MENAGTQKWINDGGILFPFNGDIVIHATPGPGVWQASQSPNPSDPRIGLIKVADSFEFPYKLYKTGGEEITERIIKLWESNEYIKTKKNLGIIFNGTKGTGKTVSAKILCNRLDIPVIIVNESFGGRILEFIQSIQFECSILIDEAEKTFSGEDSQILLKLIDGVYNSSRKLYILTTNNLTINENLLGRPGRIRYIKEFSNLPAESVSAFLDDNLTDISKKEDLIREIDLLEISTIDIIKSMVEEVNILGEIPEDNTMNIPKAKHIFDIVQFYGVDSSNEKEIKSQILDTIKNNNPEGKSLYELFHEPCDEDGRDFCSIIQENTSVTNCYTTRMTSDYSTLWKDITTSIGTVLTEPDESGFLLIKYKWGDNEELLCLILRKRDNSSLYRGKLSLVF